MWTSLLGLFSKEILSVSLVVSFGRLGRVRSIALDGADVVSVLAICEHTGRFGLLDSGC